MDSISSVKQQKITLSGYRPDHERTVSTAIFAAASAGYPYTPALMQGNATTPQPCASARVSEFT